MEESKYLELRAKLQKRSDLDAMHKEWFKMFMLSVATMLNQEHGREAVTCRFGMNEHGEFVEHRFNWRGPSFAFAFQIQFDSPNGHRLFVHAVPFKAVIRDDVLTARCEGTGQKVSLTFDECKTETGRKAVAALIDEAIEMAVDKALFDLESLNLD